MTGCYVDQFDDDDNPPGYDAHDHWVTQRDDADHYLNDRLAHEADDTRKQNKESGA